MCKVAIGAYNSKRVDHQPRQGAGPEHGQYDGRHGHDGADWITASQGINVRESSLEAAATAMALGAGST